MSELAIGIDLGTSNSSVAVVRGGRIEVLANAYGETIMASAVALREDGTILVGNEAKANVVNEPASTVTSSKRLIGRYYFSEEVKKARAICAYKIVEGPEHSVRIQIREEVFSLPEISAMILRELKTVAESRLGQEVTKAVITVPAYFNDNQRQATKDAGRIAGLEVLRILNEPTAAALAYGFGKGLSQKVAVWDLGGGTFDISVLEIGEDVFEVISSCGDTFLGGDDFDDRLIDLLADEFLQAHGQNLRQEPRTLLRLKQAAEQAKKALSTEDEALIELADIAKAADGSPLSISRRLGMAEFSKLVHDLIQRTFKVTDEALQQAGILARELDGVVLVGGPTRLPIIREAVATYFQKQPKTDVDPDVVVAMGAAIHASELVAPQQQAFLLDVTPLSLQVGVAGGFCEPVIERNTPVPIEQSRAFTTVQDDQETVVIRVYQGESKRAEENELLGQFEFSGFPKARRGQVEIQVTFAINSDGIVDVTASEPETGKRASTRMTLSSGLSDEELQSILSRNRTDRVLTEMVARAEEAAVPHAPPPEPPPARAGATRAAAAPARPAPAPAPEPVRSAPAARKAVAAFAPVGEAAVRAAAPVGEQSIELGDDADELPELEVDSDLSEAEMDALIAGSDEELSSPAVPQARAPKAPPPAQAQPPKASPEPAPPAPSKANLFEAVGTDLADVPGGHDDEEIELA
jgi:molecular chaperone DnaK